VLQVANAANGHGLRRLLGGVLQLLIWSGHGLDSEKLFQMPVPVRILALSEESSSAVENTEILLNQHPSSLFRTRKGAIRVDSDCQDSSATMFFDLNRVQELAIHVTSSNVIF
jgi:hypothetical protein